MQLRVKVTPNAKSNQIKGWADHPEAGRHLRIQITAPPVDGKANKALIAFLAKELNLPKSQICLRKGESSRLKTIELPDSTLLPDQP
ncbi:MAG: DUF167 domain-containing protein [Verrucomicrobiota bacterium JB023]|nr:DUF167 domain-containing protein [Verrucomicrobiota bacterium JB023]